MWSDLSPTWLPPVLRATLVVAGLWVAVVATLTWFQRDLLYLAPRDVATPTEAGLPEVTARQLVSADGARIAVWSASAPAGAPTIFHLHGNGGSHAILASEYRRFLAAGYGVFAMTYRGYPGSTGRPSEAANVADAIMAYDALVASGTAPSRIVVYGESLGTGIAIQLAGRRQVGAVVLESPYSSITDVAAKAYWFAPTSLLLFDRYDSMKHAARVTAPVLILHGSKDDLIPVALARRLYEALPGRKRFVELPDGGHVMLSDKGGHDAMLAFLRDELR